MLYIVVRHLELPGISSSVSRQRSRQPRRTARMAPSSPFVKAPVEPPSARRGRLVLIHHPRQFIDLSSERGVGAYAGIDLLPSEDDR